MKIRIWNYRISNIRSFRDIKIDLHEKKITLIMMPNGTGKTTSIELFKYALTGALKDKNTIHSLKPNFYSTEPSEFELHISIDDEHYIITMLFDFIENEVKYYYTDTNTGQEVKRPLELEIFTSEFVEKFIFDGELAKEFLNSDSAYAEESVKNLYHLEKLEELTKKIDKLKSDLISESEMTRASGESGLSRHNNELDKYIGIYDKLSDEVKEKKEKIDKFDEDIARLQREIDSIYSSNDKIQQNIDAHTQKIVEHRKELDGILKSISSGMLFVHNISKNMWMENKELIDILVQMKLPKSVSEQFFIDIINHAQTCICGRELDENHRQYIGDNYEKYLEENNISILNEVKSYALGIEYSQDIENLLYEAREKDREIKREETKLARAKNKINKEQKAQKEKLEADKEELVRKSQIIKTRYEMMICEDDYIIKDYKEDENLKKVSEKIRKLRAIIEQVEHNRMISYNADILDHIIQDTQSKLLERIKENVLNLTNLKVKQIIQNDEIEVESINKYIKIMNRDGVSVGQSLSVSYSFISALFENSFYDLPFVIDSPAGSLDNDYRYEIAHIIPKVFNQLVMFVISSEKSYFTETISDNYLDNVNYYTICKDSEQIKVYNQKEKFDSFQDRSESYV